MSNLLKVKSHTLHNLFIAHFETLFNFMDVKRLNLEIFCMIQGLISEVRDLKARTTL